MKFNNSHICHFFCNKQKKKKTKKAEKQQQHEEFPAALWSLDGAELRRRGISDEDAQDVLRWQSVLQLHPGHVVVERHRNHLLHGADEAVLLAAVLDHQGVGLVWVKHDVVGRYDQDAPHHSLKKKKLQTDSFAEISNTKSWNNISQRSVDSWYLLV